MLESAKKIVEVSARNLGLDKKQVDDLLEADHMHKAEIEVDGKNHTAYRVQHSNKRGPYKGGVRFHHQVDFEEVQALAVLMTLKTSAVNIPMGGGKGGVVIDPKNHTKEHLEKVSRKYVQHLHEHLGPEKDVPAPDVNTDAQVIDWMVDEYSKITGDKTKASFTGKSLNLGGSHGRESATGRGGVVVLREVLKARKLNPKNMTVAVQGIGNVGFYFAKIASEELGVSIVAVSNSKKSIYNFEGFDFSEMKFSRDVLETLEVQSDYVGDSEDILNEEVDILICAALENAITDKNYLKVKAKIVVELANGPISHSAYEKLEKSSVTVVPDILANAGGVIVSFFEWQQNIENKSWTEIEINKKLDKTLTVASNEIITYSQKNKITLKQAAFEIAIKRLV